MSKPLSDEQKIAVFRRMAQAWQDQDWPACADLFAPDGVLHSVMLEPVVGRQAIYDRISKLGGANKKVTLHIHRIGVIDGALFCERTDEIVKDGRRGESPVVGVIEFEGDRIRLWREYYDRAQLARAAGYANETHAAA
jgi:limonene-1,2-epoxide hydrolase